VIDFNGRLAGCVALLPFGPDGRANAGYLAAGELAMKTPRRAATSVLASAEF